MIMTFCTTVLKNLFSKPVTKSYPMEPAQFTERTRGHVEINMDACVLCGLCGKKCPSDAIAVDRSNNTWSISRFDCVQCGHCITVCRKDALKIIPGYPEPGSEKGLAVFRKGNPSV